MAEKKTSGGNGKKNNGNTANEKKTASSGKSGNKGRTKASARTKKNQSAPSSEVDVKIDKIYRKKRLIDEVIAMCMVALGIFLIMSVMTTATGRFGEIISMVLKGLFGLCGYILPFYIIVFSLFVLMGKMAYINGRTLFFTFLMFIDICMLNSARFGAVSDPLFGLEFCQNAFNDGVNLESGGVVGMTLAWLLVRFIDVAGLVLVGVLIMIICLMFIVDTPISYFFENRKINRLQKELEREQLRKYEQEQRDAADEQAREQAGIAAAAAIRERQTGGNYAIPQIPVAEPSGEVGKPSFLSKNGNIFDEGQKDGDDHTDNMNDNRTKLMELMEDKDLFAGSGNEEAPAREEETGGFGFFGRKKSSSGKKNVADSVADEAVSAEPDRPVSKKETPKAPVSAAQSHADMLNSEEPGIRLPKMSKAEVTAAVTQGAAMVQNQIDNSQNDDRNYVLPPTDLLNKPSRRSGVNTSELEVKAAELEKVLETFHVNAHVIDVKRGPSVTRYEIQPDTGVKVNSIVRLSDDIALNLEAKSLRMEAPIPGKAAVGIEVENSESDTVTLRELVESNEFRNAKSKISFIVGEDIEGKTVVGDLKGMPHLLIAGSTGSGKSVCINSMIMSFLYNSTPDEVKLILIDPKVVELSNYNGIPHMLIPVVTDPPKAAAALAWAVAEMDNRYKKFADFSVRDLKSYNEKLVAEDPEAHPLPQIVIIIDELADLMMAAAKQVEESICRLAQKARAAGMHLVVATQRPSVDVVTGLIKANIPSRIAFAVSSQVDSRTILDRAGAEKLVGKGDMLYYPLGKAQPERLQGPFVTDEEVNSVIDFWKAQADPQMNAEFENKILKEIETVDTGIDEQDDEEDELMTEAIDLVLTSGQASASMLQRRFRIGYNRAGRLIDIMEARGIIGPSEGSRPRRVLMTKAEYEDALRPKPKSDYSDGENVESHGNHADSAVEDINSADASGVETATENVGTVKEENEITDIAAPAEEDNNEYLH